MDVDDLPPSYTDQGDSPPPYEAIQGLCEPTITIALHFRMNGTPYPLHTHSISRGRIVNVTNSTTFDQLQTSLQGALQRDRIFRRLRVGWKLVGIVYTLPSPGAASRGLLRDTASALSRALLGFDMTIPDEEVDEVNWENVLGRLWEGELEGLSLVVWPVRQAPLSTAPNYINNTRRQPDDRRAFSRTSWIEAQTNDEPEDNLTIPPYKDPPEYSIMPEPAHRHLDSAFSIKLIIRYHVDDTYGMTGVSTPRKQGYHLSISESTPFYQLFEALKVLLRELGLSSEGDGDITALRRRGIARFWGRAGPGEIDVTEENWEEVIAGFRQGEYEALQHCFY